MQETNAIDMIHLSTGQTAVVAHRVAASAAGENHRPDQTQHVEKQELRELKVRDRAVRRHEQAHAAAAGELAMGGPQYEYTRGPDGRLYATGGKVNIDTSPVPGDPQATLDKAQKIHRAALAPSYPSAEDRAVAAKASAMAMEARIEMQRESTTIGARVEHQARAGGYISTDEPYRSRPRAEGNMIKLAV